MTDSPVAIVTGGAHGIGATICIELLKNGYRVCVADIQKSKAEEFANEQRKIFGEENVTAIQCDVREESYYEKVFEETLKHFKRVDVLVNNAGIILPTDLQEYIQVNLLGSLYGCHAALKYMGKSKGGNGGAVINTAPIEDVGPIPELPGYIAIKHDLVNLTRSFGLPFYYEKDEVLFASLCPYVDAKTIKAINKACKLELDSSSGSDKLSPEYAAKGVLKLLEDKINGSTLLVVPNGYHYYEPID
ncbi:15-hydroxyprostaglandin dehydrogenase [NAD(+)]-like [Argiope bruennichi]|uniref:15-hydroxyprostaglandin dehydrogenase [NAD(+)]-like n=1 Tax=Argiope bruennichi TaxID=94029 RepID=UPI00249543BE|nr:15-hydroxyprostaglandin dehydrogenase [NAD(+)]-like [Argiope bruennichi]